MFGSGMPTDSPLLVPGTMSLPSSVASFESNPPERFVLVRRSSSWYFSRREVPWPRTRWIFLLDQSETPYAALAGEMGTSDGALKVAIHRLRKRYRDLFRMKSRRRWPIRQMWNLNSGISRQSLRGRRVFEVDASMTLTETTSCVSVGVQSRLR
jgi:hypothetical protein